MRLILLTLPCAVEPVPLDTCFEAGLQTLHVRKPDWTRPQLRAYLQTVAPQYRRRLVLHSCHELSAEFDVGGIHYTERSRPPAPIRRPREGLTVSTSFHELAQLRAGWGDLDYAFLSPVADSISKSGYGAAFEEAAIGAALATATVPVVALGGMRTERLEALDQLGFCGAAMLGAVWQAADPLKALTATLAQADRLGGQRRR